MKKIVLITLFFTHLLTNHVHAQDLMHSLNDIMSTTEKILLENNQDHYKEQLYTIAAFLINNEHFHKAGVIFTRAVTYSNPVDRILNLILLENYKKVPACFVQLLRLHLMANDPEYIIHREQAYKKLNILIQAIEIKRTITILDNKL